MANDSKKVIASRNLIAIINAIMEARRIDLTGASADDRG
jgi:hypothetical protein